MEQPTPDSQALQRGTHLEEFVIERVLGSGGFGITYLALDTGLGRQVVIKENLPAQFAWRETTTGTVRPRHSSTSDAEDFEWSMKNFLREAETLASLDHPGMVRVLRKFATNGTAYFVMPFVEGVAFDSLIEERKTKDRSFSEAELGGLLERMLSALGYLHQRGIYHRDIKPANILITTEGIPVLIDFGSARQRLSERSMTVVESAGYTPFEQLQSRGNIGPWSDLYALGATLAKAITWETPPRAADRMMGDPWTGLANSAQWASSYSRLFLHAIDRSMAVDPSHRWQNAEEWISSFRQGGGSPPLRVAHTRPPPMPPTRPPHAIIPTMAVPAQAKGPTGIGGWLVFFCVILTILSPLLVLGQMANNWEQARPTFVVYPSIRAACMWENLGMAALLIYGFIVGCMIWTGNPRGREIAKKFLLIRFLAFIGVEVIGLVMMGNLPSEILVGGIAGVFGSVFQAMFFFLVWWFYFKKSKRVRNTYGVERA